jgi:transcriptional regulator with XRE-family HTH domain
MKRGPNPTDQHVGSRIRVRRLMLGKSQTELANATGVTFQQVQKYENGSNRVSASRLQQISLFLQVPVHFFFEGLPTTLKTPLREDDTSHITEFLSTSDGIALARAFTAVESPELRRHIVRLVEKITRTGDD